MSSSVIHGMLYSPADRSLVIVFREDGRAYRYRDVTLEEWRAFKRSPSKGTYLNAVFKAKHPRVEAWGSVSSETGAVAAAAGPLRDLPDGNIWGFFEQF